MSLIFVTGISGSGKSIVREELSRRGFQAYDTDEHEIARWKNRVTGEITPLVAAGRTPEFIAQNDWQADPERMRHLVKEGEERTVFLCGIVGYDDEVWPFFDKVFVLSIDEPTMRYRLATRTTHDFGTKPHELELLLASHDAMNKQYLRYGAVTIDATKPPTVVVDEILRLGAFRA
jgi:broad-specificity NMP kinase